MSSYTSGAIGLHARAVEALALLRAYRGGRGRNAELVAQRLGNVERLVEDAWGRPLSGLHMLDIGCGQTMAQALYFGARNTVDAIDYDTIPRPWHPLDYLTMWRRNGTMRLAKTIGRKVLGTDRAYRRNLARVLGTDRIRPPRIMRMDAGAMTLADAQYDFVYSFSVFEHLPEPRRALQEAVRILRPGGAMYISLHLYTSDSGIHDPRIFANRRDAIPLWSHLRPRHAHLVHPNAYLNRLRLNEWHDLFNTVLPGCRIEHIQYNRERLQPELDQLRRNGELLDYSDDELFTYDVAAIWVKPPTKAASPAAAPYTTEAPPATAHQSA